MKKRMFKVFGVLRLAGLVLVGLGVGCAQESGGGTPVGHNQSELGYFLEQQDITLASGAKLLGQMDDLKKKYDVDPHAALREQIREREEFVRDVQRLHSKAQKVANPALLPSLDWLARDVQESVIVLKADLGARQRSADPERLALKSLIDKKQKEIDINRKLAKTLVDTIKSVQDDHRRDVVASELDALIKTDGTGVISTSKPVTNAAITKKEH